MNKSTSLVGLDGLLFFISHLLFGTMLDQNLHGNQKTMFNSIMYRDVRSWKFWSPRPKFSVENMVRLMKNRSGLKTFILGLFS